jgi:hypothetical protein
MKPLPFKYWVLLQRAQDLAVAAPIIGGPILLGYYLSPLIRGGVEALVGLGKAMGY